MWKLRNSGSTTYADFCAPAFVYAPEFPSCSNFPFGSFAVSPHFYPPPRGEQNGLSDCVGKCAWYGNAANKGLKPFGNLNGPLISANTSNVGRGRHLSRKGSEIECG